MPVEVRRPCFYQLGSRGGKIRYIKMHYIKMRSVQVRYIPWAVVVPVASAFTRWMMAAPNRLLA